MMHVPLPSAKFPYSPRKILDCSDNSNGLFRGEQLTQPVCASISWAHCWLMPQAPRLFPKEVHYRPPTRCDLTKDNNLTPMRPLSVWRRAQSRNGGSACRKTTSLGGSLCKSLDLQLVGKGEIDAVHLRGATQRSTEQIKVKTPSEICRAKHRGSPGRQFKAPSQYQALS